MENSTSPTTTGGKFATTIVVATTTGLYNNQTPSDQNTIDKIDVIITILVIFCICIIFAIIIASLIYFRLFQKATNKINHLLTYEMQDTSNQKTKTTLEILEP